MTALRRSIMTLYSGELCPFSHRVRIVLAEKGVTVDILNVDLENPPEDWLSLNPYGTVPTLVDRDLVLYESSIIMEYLDERFPHPPLLPVYPVARAKTRLMMHRVDRDWYELAFKIKHEADATKQDDLRKALLDSLMSVAPIFSEMPYFLSDDFSLVDCCMAPLLWRLPEFGIELPKKAKPIIEYADRLFERESFQVSLTEAEREIRDSHDDF